MNATQLLAHFDRLAEAPNAVPRMRRFILDLAVRGKLVEQDVGDEPAVKLLKRIRSLARKSLAPKKSNQQVDAPDADVDQPFEIPQSWAWTRLFELGRTQTGATPSKNAGEVYGNHMPFVKPGDLLPSHVDYSGEGLSELGLKDSGRFTPAGSLLMVCIGTIGKCQLVDRACSFNQQINSIAPHDGLESRYLLAVFMSEFFQSAAWTASAKTTIAILNKGKWEQLSVPLPPLAEQHRIVAKVDELMALCDQLEAAQQECERRRDRLAAASLQRLNQPAADTTPEAQREHARFHLHHLPRLTTRPEHIKAMRQTILNLAVRGKLVEQDAGDEPATELLTRIHAERLRILNKPVKGSVALATEFDSTDIELPVGWTWSRLGSLCTKTGSGSTPSGGKDSYVSSGVPFLRSQNVYDEGLRLDGVAFISESTQERMSSTTVKPGDLLLNITGGSIGRCAIVPDSFVIGNINQHVAIIRLTLLESRRFLHSVICSDYFQKNIFGNQTGAGREGLPKNRMDEILIPVAPLAEQHRIVAKVVELMALCDQLEAQLTTTQTDSRRLLEAVLEAALAPV